MELKASASGIIPEDELARMRKVMTDAQYEQEMECSFSAPVLGTYYAGIIETLEKKQQIAHGACEYDPAFPVNVATDLGYTDSTAFWFWQYRPDGIAIIRSYENQSQPLQHYFDYLDSLGYEYGDFWLPHDARARTLQTDRSTVEQFVEHFNGTTANIQITPMLKRQHGIDSARLVLPNCWFNLTDCTDGVQALRSYRRKYDSVRNVFSDEPFHDWASNYADSFRYLSIVCKDSLLDVRDSAVLNGLYVDNHKKTLNNENMTLNKLFDEKNRFMRRQRARI